MLTTLLGLIGFATALLSGVFGMAGGMLLMGAYTTLLPVPSAMVLHGGTQMLSNSSRALLLLDDVYWPGLLRYALGAGIAVGALSQLHFVPDPLLVFAGLGLAPFVARWLPARCFDFQRPLSAVVTGAQVAGMQVLAGAAGPLLDIAFVETRLTRTQVVATKAVTQVLSHGLKLAYFARFTDGRELTLQLLLALGVATLAGTVAGTHILKRLSDETFRRWSRHIVDAIGALYLCKAALMLLLR